MNAEVLPSAADQPPEWEAERPSRFESLLVAWGEETYRRNIPFANEVLRLLVTLCVGLAGGSVSTLAPAMHPLLRALVTLLFVGALAAALCGVVPFEGRGVELYNPASVKAHKEGALRAKLRWLWLSVAAILAGFLVAALGVFLQAAVGRPPAP
jgi:hypothetical protein